MNNLTVGLKRTHLTDALEQQRAEWHKNETELSLKITSGLSNQPHADKVRSAVSDLLTQQPGLLQAANSEQKLKAVHVRFCSSVAVWLALLSEGDLDTLQIGPLVQFVKLCIRFQRVKLGQDRDELRDITSRFLKCHALDLACESASMLSQVARDNYFSNISLGYAGFEEYDESLQTARRIEDICTRSSTKAHIVTRLAEAQNFERAKEVAATIEDIGKQEDAYGTIARELINCGRVDEGLALMLPRDPSVKGSYVFAPRDRVILCALKRHLEKSCLSLPKEQLKAEEFANLLYGEEAKDEAFVTIIEALLKYSIKLFVIEKCKELADTKLSNQKSKDRAYGMIMRKINCDSKADLPIALALREPYRKEALARFVDSFIKQGAFDDARMLVDEHMNSVEEQQQLSDKILLQEVENSYTSMRDDINKAVAMAHLIKDKHYNKEAFRYLAARILDIKPLRDVVPLRDAVAIASTVIDTESREHLLCRIIDAFFNPVLNLFPKDEDRDFAREIAEKLTIPEYKIKAHSKTSQSLHWG